MRKCLFRALASIALTVCSLGNVYAQQRPVSGPGSNEPQGTQPTIFIAADGGFSTSLAAALLKKHVPITIVTDKANATYILQSAAVDSKDESGAGKIARCLFIDCIGMNGSSEVSVELLKNPGGIVVWAYQVRKGFSGPQGVQSLSEAIAKHLKSDYLKK
jgi:hypothetical protein